MKAAIMSPGPSLAKLINRPQADLVLAVNRAVLVHRPDWWVFTDAETFAENDPGYRPKVFTSSGAMLRAGSLGCVERMAKHNPLFYEDPAISPQYTQPIDGARWTLYSITAAIILAYHLGARITLIYGADMAGIADYDGQTNERNTRDDVRWAREREHLSKIIGWVNQHGGTVEHGTPQ